MHPHLPEYQQLFSVHRVLLQLKVLNCSSLILYAVIVYNAETCTTSLVIPIAGIHPDGNSVTRSCEGKSLPTLPSSSCAVYMVDECIATSWWQTLHQIVVPSGGSLDKLLSKCCESSMHGRDFLRSSWMLKLVQRHKTGLRLREHESNAVPAGWPIRL